MRRHLGVKTRIAIVVTGLWLVSGTLWFHLATMRQRNAFASNLYGSCVHGFEHLQEQFPSYDYSKDIAHCMVDMTTYLNSEPPWTQVLGVSFLLAVAAALLTWLILLAVIATIRWVLRGRQENA